VNTSSTTVRDILRATTKRLQSAGIDQPELAAGILISAKLNCSRLEIYLRTDEKPTSAQIYDIEDGARRLARNEPIHYVLGQTDFRGNIFKCDRRALIPRPETEELVELIVSCAALWKIGCPSIIDIGTGTGCIIVSLAIARKMANYFAVDISAEAIALAEENARAGKVAAMIKFITADFSSGEIPSGMDAVVANPPYVRSVDFDRLDKNVRLWEPRLALDGGKDGLQVVRPLVQKAYQILKPGRFLFMEIGFDQWPAVQELLSATGFSQNSVCPDGAGHNRLVMAVK